MSEVRLQLVLAQRGIASRRHAEEMILAGRVSVDGKVVTALGTKVDPERDLVAVDGKALGEAEPPVTVILNKPAAVLTTLDDPEGRETVADLVGREPYKLRPIGRLDYHTEGALLLTTDGELANRLLHPRYHVPKTYLVKVGGHPTPGVLDKLRNGVDLEDGKTRPAVVEVVSTDGPYTWMEMVLTEGRNRLVRRMCEHVDHRPLRVVRTEFGTIGLGDLRPGEYRYLTRAELSALYSVAGLKVPPQPEDERPEESGDVRLGVARRRKAPLPGEERRTDDRKKPTTSSRDATRSKRAAGEESSQDKGDPGFRGRAKGRGDVARGAGGYGAPKRSDRGAPRRHDAFRGEAGPEPIGQDFGDEDFVEVVRPERGPPRARSEEGGAGSGPRTGWAPRRDTERSARPVRSDTAFKPRRSPRDEGGFKPRRSAEGEGGFKPRWSAEGEGGFKPLRSAEGEGGFKPRRSAEGEGGFKPRRSPRDEGGFKPRRAFPERASGGSGRGGSSLDKNRPERASFGSPRDQDAGPGRERGSGAPRGRTRGAGPRRPASRGPRSGGRPSRPRGGR